ncbi:hypothetical protein B0H63DRAFT_558071 [Podospora didyma]|uniref:T6SS Phospholipase effector Tle1-like catalytic domain-containing protein n=1 Tax=Podospora didyma TaxID=330526 RepID=A0AAE0U5J4_9PEZI|nr:hypothetical protein B0H63DRAFT_558071 [Podospora didyma]
MSKEADPDGSWLSDDDQDRKIYTDPLDFQKYLKQQPNTTANHLEGIRVIILEGQAPAHISALGTHFGTHPSFFVDHERGQSPESFQAAAECDSTALPSVVRDYITMGYYEPISLPADLLRFHVFCAESGRHISMTRVFGKFAETGVLHRKGSVWRRARGNDEGTSSSKGWDCVVITDPPLRAVGWSSSPRSSNDTGSGSGGYNPSTTLVTTWPSQGGYADFVPRQGQMTHIAKATSSRKIDPPGPAADPATTRKQLAFLNALVSYIQHSMSRHDKLDRFDTQAVEKQWSDVQAFERRASENDWRSADADFQFLHMMLKDVQRRIGIMGSSITGLAGIAGNRQTIEEQVLSRREATSVKALTVVGLVFIPLGYASSLFGMTAPYDPGEPLFYVYFAVAGPLSALAFVTYFDYIFNGVTAQDLDNEVIDAYRFIVDHYHGPGAHEIWLFGLSRAYGLYRSKDKANHPKSKSSRAFRARMSWPQIRDEEYCYKLGAFPPHPPPVRFMGIFDTVGSHGILNFVGGVGYEWPTFHDNEVSSVVQDVCHLMSIHDRLHVFQPYPARRKGNSISVLTSGSQACITTTAQALGLRTGRRPPR